MDMQSTSIKKKKNSEAKKRIYKIPSNIVDILDTQYSENMYPSQQIMKTLATQFGYTLTKIENWFKHKRARQAKKGLIQIQKRKTFTFEQRKTLKNYFDQCFKPSIEKLTQIALELQCETKQVRYWFFHKRKEFYKKQKDKRRTREENQNISQTQEQVKITNENTATTMTQETQNINNSFIIDIKNSAGGQSFLQEIVKVPVYTNSQQMSLEKISLNQQSQVQQAAILQQIMQNIKQNQAMNQNYLMQHQNFNQQTVMNPNNATINQYSTLNVLAQNQLQNQQQFQVQQQQQSSQFQQLNLNQNYMSQLKLNQAMQQYAQLIQQQQAQTNLDVRMKLQDIYQQFLQIQDQNKSQILQHLNRLYSSSSSSNNNNLQF